MHTSIVKWLSTSVGAAAMAGMSVLAVAEGVSVNLENGKTIFTQGKGDVPACNSCHGQDGMGDDNLGTPRLAGQIYQFVVKQLEDFATDKRMDETMFVMNANAKGLSPQDRRDVAAYVNSLPATNNFSNREELKANGHQVGETHLGKAIVLYGIAEKNVPACKSCHGHNGRGVDPIYPKIGQQKFVYLVNQLKRWRDGSRANDPLGQMRAVAKNLSDEEIASVAAYLVDAPETTLGNTRVPVEHKPFEH